jgi:ABC-type lipoprotein export system ATPase subunit
VDVAGLDAEELARCGAEIGFVFQGFNLLPRPDAWATSRCR